MSSLTVSVRGRRLVFVAALAPGVVLVLAGVQLWQSPALLGLGVLWIGAAAVAHRVLAARLRVRTAPSSSSSPRETAP